MKYKIVVKTIDVVEIDAETADAAVEKFKSQTNPRVLGGPVSFEVIEANEETT